MSERVRMTESGARPDDRAPAPNPYYFPAASYDAARDAYPPQPPVPQGYPGYGYPGQGYQGEGYRGSAYPQPAPYPYPQGPAMPPYVPMPAAVPPYAAQPYASPPPYHPAPSYHQATPAGYGYAPARAPYASPPADPQVSAGNVDEAVAQIAARIRALDTDPAEAGPFAPASAPPRASSNYADGADPYAPPHARQPQHVAPPLAPAYAPEAPHYAEPQRIAPGPDLSGLESQIRNLTAQIETLRQPMPDFSGALRELREDLAEISNRLLEAMPRRAIDALEAEVRRLAERIDLSRAAGVDPDAIAGMERSLADVRDAIRSLKPAESLAGFEQAVRNLTERIDQSAGVYQDAASLQQLESSIVALRGIVANVASNDTLAGLSEEIRGLSAKVDRVATSSRGIDSEMLHSLEQRIANLPVLGAIERGFADLKARFDQFQVPAPQPVIDPTPAVDHLKRDLVRTQDSLEAVHSTLGHLVDRLAMIEGGIREARFAAEAPAPMPMPAHMPAPMSAPMPAAMPMQTAKRPPLTTELPLQPAEAPHIAPVAAPQPSTRPAAAMPASPDAPKPEIRSAVLEAVKAKAEPMPASAPEPAQAKPLAPPMRERNAIDPSLPPDFPLEPGSGTPRVRPPASAAERIAASEAALGSAKPGGANHPGQTNFIAAARRAAQAAAAAAPEMPADKSDESPDRQGKSITRKVRSLFVGASAIILIAASARVAIDMLDPGNQSVAEITAPVIPEGDEAPEQQKAPVIAAPVTLPIKPDVFAAPPSGVIERPHAAAQPAASAPVDPISTGSVSPGGRRLNPLTETPPALARGPLPPLPEKLPTALRNAAAKGQPAAEFEVGIRQIEGRGVAQNTEAGLRWLERAAEAGLAPAHFRIAGLYEKGTGVKKNLAIARRHYVAAAEKGNAKAMHNLAVLYAEGIEGKPDYKTAAEWFRRAAEFGVADSQYNLAILHARGIGVDQNILESYKWLALAAQQGDNDAAKKRDEIASKLDAASLAAARTAVRSFTAQQQPDDSVSVAAPPGGWDKPAAEKAPARKPRAGSVVKVTAS
jgi:localization factor PodJL